VSEWRFVFGYVVFILILIVFFGLSGSSRFLVGTSPEITFTPPPPPSADPFTTLIYVVSNIGILFTLMIVSPFSAISILAWISVAGGITVF